jgi:hypothetical protein
MSKKWNRRKLIKLIIISVVYVDGDFGWQTLQSVKNFQRQFGMKVDGIAGAKTKLKLWEATKNWRPGAEGGAKARTTGGRTNLPVQMDLDKTASKKDWETYLLYVGTEVTLQIQGYFRSPSFKTYFIGFIFISLMAFNTTRTAASTSASATNNSDA